MRGLTTEFAPPGRATRDLLVTQSRHFMYGPLFRHLLDNVPDMIMILNSDRQVVYANRAVVGFGGGGDPDAIIGLRPGEIFRCKHSGETTAGCGTTRFCRYCGAVKSILQAQDGHSSVEECRMVVTTGREDEQALDLRVWASPMRIDDEQFTFFVVVNIADEKRRLWLEKVFLHDLMNTAIALRGFSGLLNRDGRNVPQQDENIRYISALSNRIINEIESHRQLVAAEHNELEVTVAKVNARKVIEEVFTTYNNPEMLNGRLLRIDARSRATELEGDRALLVRVIGNMVKNAIEGSVPGEQVTIGCRSAADSVQFWVHNPTYIPENIRLQIFNRSFSTKGAGRGLGTYSMKLLTENYLGGKIRFTSVEGKGTTFIATYPIHLHSASSHSASSRDKK